MHVLPKVCDIFIEVFTEVRHSHNFLAFKVCKNLWLPNSTQIIVSWPTWKRPYNFLFKEIVLKKGQDAEQLENLIIHCGSRTCGQWLHHFHLSFLQTRIRVRCHFPSFLIPKLCVKYPILYSIISPASTK